MDMATLSLKGHQAPLLTVMTAMMHVNADMCPLHLVLHLHSHAPCCCIPCLLGTCHHMHHIAMSLMAACTMLSCLRWLMLYSYIFLFLFSANSIFCSPVTTLSLPSLLMDMWLFSPSRAYFGTTTDHNDNDNSHLRTMTMAVALYSITGTATTTSHGVTIVTMTPYAA